MKSIYLLIVYVLFISLSCTDKTNHYMTLSKVDHPLSFKLDRHTRNWTQALFIYQDKDGKEYLTFQNEGYNEILFYDLDTQNLQFKVTPQIAGNNGVGVVLGYHIHNLDSIFLTIAGLEEIPIINKEAIVIDKLACEMTSDSIPVKQFYSTSSIYQPLIVNNNKLYIIPGCNRWGKENPMCISLDLKNKDVHRYPLNYPHFEGADNEAKRAGVEEYLSRCFNGKEFIYSFYYDEDIYITSIDQKTIQRKKVKSDYVNKIVLPDDHNQTLDLQSSLKRSCESSNYGKLLYDKYRNVYYRIAYPETEIEKGVNCIELMQYGRKVFSVIILDKDFNKIGETLFPEYQYNADMIFIREDGVYISSSHPLNPNFNDDILSFQKFELKENKR